MKLLKIGSCEADKSRTTSLEVSRKNQAGGCLDREKTSRSRFLCAVARWHAGQVNRIGSLRRVFAMPTESCGFAQKTALPARDIAYSFASCTLSLCTWR